MTTYGIWGFAMISSPTWRSAIDIGLRYLDLTFAFTRIQARDPASASIEAASRAGCERVLSEDLNAGQEIRGVRIENPFT